MLSPDSSQEKLQQKITTKIYQSSAEEILDFFGVDPELGRLDNEIPQLLAYYGYNRFKEEQKKSGISIFFSHFNDMLTYVLFAAVIITGLLGQYIDATIIFIVILINALLSTFQEIKANDALAALKKLSSPSALVRRGGIVKEIPIEEVVLGDIVILEAGHYVPADVKLITSHTLRVDESLLTGESLAVQKDAEVDFGDFKLPFVDRKDLVFMSTLVSYGRGVGVVLATGMDTELGKIAKSLDSSERIKTPLEVKMEGLAKTLGFLAIGISLVMFLVGLLQGRNIAELFLISVSLAVAAIPEGLAAVVAIVLSIGVTKMSRENAIVRKLYAVEGLGAVNIICSDKTGTLTQNRMTVVQYVSADGNGKIKRGGNNQVSDTIQLLAKGMVVCSDATYSEGVATGDPTEIALLLFADDLQIDRDTLLKEYPRVTEYPFDSDRKMMSTLSRVAEDQYRVFTKGAMDKLLEISSWVLLDGEVVPLTEELKAEFYQDIEKLSSQALRTLGLAYKDSHHLLSPEEMESELVLVGMVGMIDPPRPEVKEAISLAQDAGIMTIMITGDHQHTAFAIGRELGIVEQEKQVISGYEMDQLSDHQLFQTIHQYRIFARVSPEHKVKIVQALQGHKNIVAMTGDGVNDAPSLKAADVGVAMGVGGTDVAKGAAEIVLADDNFGTIVNAVSAGRNIYNNIKKSINFLLSCNLGEVVTMLVAIISGWASPLSATQLLWINLITDSLPAIALGMDPDDPEVMKLAPRKIKTSFFSKLNIFKDLSAGISIGIVTLFAFFFAYREHGYHPAMFSAPEATLSYARTMAFLVLISAQLFYSFALRNPKKSIFTKDIKPNYYLFGALLLGLGLQFLLMGVPFLQKIFGLQMLSLRDWLVVLVLGLLPLALSELIKRIAKKNKDSFLNSYE